MKNHFNCFVFVMVFFNLVFQIGLFAQEPAFNDSAKTNLSTNVVQNNGTTTPQLYQIVKSDKSEYVGYILSDDGREILIETQNIGKIYIQKSEVLSINLIEDTRLIVRGEVYDAGPFTTRYMFTTNGLPLKKGANYAILNLHGPEVHFALSNNFSIGIMTSWIASPYVVVFKKTFPNKQVDKDLHFSLATMFGTSGYLFNGRGFGGLHFASLTKGNARNNINLSAGYTYFNVGDIKTNAHPYRHGPLASLAGIVKVGAKASFVFDSMIGYLNFYKLQSVYGSGYSGNTGPADYTDENWSYTKSGAFFVLLMPAMRFQTQPNSAFQISIAGVSVTPKGYASLDSDKTVTIPIPMLSWMYKF